MKAFVRLLNALIVAFSLSMLLTQVKASGSSAIPNGGAVVLDLSGTIEVHDPNGHKLSVARESVLSEGTMIETSPGAKMLLRLEDGSEVLIGPHARLLLKREYLPTGTTLFDLLLGRIKAVVTKRYTGNPSFQLGTPSAIIAVRGTRFYVEVNSHEVTEVDVEQGVVQVAGRKDTDNFVLLEPGFSTRVGPDMNPEAPVPTESIRPDVRDQRENDTQHDALDHHPSSQPLQQDQQQSDRPDATDQSPEK